jgi:hypothetical protein
MPDTPFCPICGIRGSRPDCEKCGFVGLEEVEDVYCGECRPEDWPVELSGLFISGDDSSLVQQCDSCNIHKDDEQAGRILATWINRKLSIDDGDRPNMVMLRCDHYPAWPGDPRLYPREVRICWAGRKTGSVDLDELMQKILEDDKF